MNRRRFLKTFASATASVAIGLKLAQAFPQVEIVGAVELEENYDRFRWCSYIYPANMYQDTYGVIRWDVSA